MRYSHETFISKLEDKHPEIYNEYEFIGEYTTAQEKIQAIHKPCGNNVWVTPMILMRGDGCCKPCGIKKRAKTQRKDHDKFVEEVSRYGLHPLTDYQGAYRDITVMCDKCGKTYTTIPHNILRGGTVVCSRCSNMYTHTVEEIAREVSNETGYLLVSDTYINAHTKVTIKHIECGTTYQVTMANFRKGRRCPTCKLSVGEQRVSKYLDRKNIKYEMQKGFDDLRYKNPLKYDFYLPDYNILIEYHGEQHYKDLPFFRKKESFEVRQERDLIKERYASSKGYKLHTIPYTIDTDGGITEYLDQILFP